MLLAAYATPEIWNNTITNTNVLIPTPQNPIYVKYYLSSK